MIISKHPIPSLKIHRPSLAPCSTESCIAEKETFRTPNIGFDKWGSSRGIASWQRWWSLSGRIQSSPKFEPKSCASAIGTAWASQTPVPVRSSAAIQLKWPISRNFNRWNCTSWPKPSEIALGTGKTVSFELAFVRLMGESTLQRGKRPHL